MRGLDEFQVRENKGEQKGDSLLVVQKEVYQYESLNRKVIQQGRATLNSSSYFSQMWVSNV
jgi:hypothetical protein